MKFPRSNPYYTASLLLVVAAAVQLAVAILTDHRDLTSAALVVSSVICFITGIFLAILSTAEPLDIRYVSRLPVRDASISAGSAPIWEFRETGILSRADGKARDAPCCSFRSPISKKSPPGKFVRIRGRLFRVTG